MRARVIYRQAAGRWHRAVAVRWYRVQSAVAGAYHRRVTGPAVLWQALGCPPQLRPRLPWWQPLAWHWLHLTGWLPRAPRIEKS
ncbi:hypothetical protein GC207_01985 [bacterium]|nr:hypothetical protein [bacterium]